jgi:hypothetical protein
MAFFFCPPYPERMNYDELDYLFDLRGYLILENAVSADHVVALNDVLDSYLDLEFDEWRGNVHRNDNNGVAGMELQNIVEAGEPFEALIDHQAWVERLVAYVGEKDSYVEGLFIDECFASIRRHGGYFPLHSGGHEGVVRNQYGFVNGRFRCGQVNILLALTDIGPGDGGTRILPGSHKANLSHPVFAKSYEERIAAGKMEEVEGVIEVHLKKGDALLFVDAVTHGATTRVNPGERRAVVYRYGPTWGSSRYGYQYSPALLERLTPSRRKILQPVAPKTPEAKPGLTKSA